LNQQHTFLVRSSDGVSSYTVDFLISDDSAMVLCSCPAGAKGKTCKHKILLLKNRSDLLVDTQQIEQLDSVLKGLQKSNLFNELQCLEEAESAYELALLSLNRAKKRFENVLKGTC
jgi:hypothetical protein